MIQVPSTTYIACVYVNTKNKNSVKNNFVILVSLKKKWVANYIVCVGIHFCVCILQRICLSFVTTYGPFGFGPIKYCCWNASTWLNHSIKLDLNNTRITLMDTNFNINGSNLMNRPISRAATTTTNRKISIHKMIQTL